MLIHIRHFSIKNKLIGLMLLTTTLALLLAASVLLVNEWFSLRRNLSADLHTLADVVSINGGVGLAFNNREAMQQTLTSLQAKPNIVYAHAFDRSGQLFASYFQSEQDNTPEPELRQHYPADLIDNGPLQQNRDFFYRDHLDVFTRIMVDGSLLGTLYIRSDLKEFARRRHQYILVIVVTSLGALLLAYLLALRLQGLITEPVQHLLSTMNQVSQAQDYSLRATHSSRDEVGHLQAGFNAMLEKIQKNNQQLDKYRLHLEQLVQERTREKEKAVDANQAKTRFFAAASHDLRQPLHALNWFLDVLRQRVQETENREILAQAQQSVDAMQTLFNALLDMSKLEAGVMTADIKSVALNDLCQHLYVEFVPLVAQKNLTLQMNVETVSVQSDPLLLERILRNLLSNAYKYTEQGQIQLHAHSQDGVVQLTVEDTGIGIPAAQQVEVFREFHQLHNPERDRAKGLGLGLSIVQRLAALLQHPLTLHSEEERGTRFVLTLPASAAPPETSLSLPATPSLHTHNGKMLLIDDEVLIRDAMGTLLRDWGHEVITAESESEAIHHLQKTSFLPDIIIADYRLRDNLTGVEAIQNVQQYCQQEIPAILITGDTLPENLQAAKLSGHQLLFKPVKPAQLRKLLGYYLRHKKGF